MTARSQYRHDGSLMILVLPLACTVLRELVDIIRRARLRRARLSGAAEGTLRMHRC